MRIHLQPANPAEAAAIAALQVAAFQKLTARFGPGPWSGKRTEKGVLFDMRNAVVYVLRQRNKVIATLTLGPKKPWAIDRKYFSKCDRPLYLTSMAVAPDLQRQGIGRRCLEDARKIVKQWPGGAIVWMPMMPRPVRVSSIANVVSGKSAGRRIGTRR